MPAKKKVNKVGGGEEKAKPTSTKVSRVAKDKSVPSSSAGADGETEKIDSVPKKKADKEVVGEKVKQKTKSVKTDALKQSSPIELRPTGIDELDVMLGGGLPKKATVLVSGGAGVGKTILAMQWLFEGYTKHKETGVYITLTESTTVAIHNLADKKFFNRDDIASSDMNVSGVESEIVGRPGVHFVDLRQLLEEMNLLKTEYSFKDVDAIHEVLFKMIMHANVSRVVIDSITAIAYLLNDKSLIRTFIYKMGKFLALSDANTLLVGEAQGKKESVFGVEEFIADGVIKLQYVDDVVFPFRTLQIRKMRGIAFDSHPTAYKITSDGIQLFPKEAKGLTYEASTDRVPTGISGFDRLISGGLIAESAVLVSGPSGGGKTLFSMQSMVTSLKNGRKCMYISYEESRDQLIRNAREFGWDLEKYEKKGLLRIEAIHPEKVHLAELILKTRLAVKSFEPTLVIIDSLTAMDNLYGEEVVHDWASQLISMFKKEGVLSMFLSTTTNLVGANVASNVGISSLFDQIIMLRYVEIDAEFHHAILVVKMRGSKHDKRMYEFVFGKNGLKVLHSFSGYEGIFAGSAKQISRSKEEQLRELFMEVLGPMGQKIFGEQREKGLSVQNVDNLTRELSEDGILGREKEMLFSDKVMKIFQGVK